MKIILIAAASENNVIGKNGKIPWDLPDDVKHFRDLTQGRAIVMGRKTFESLGKPLPKRRNIVVTHSDRIFDGCETVHSFEEALKVCADESEVWVIGGGGIYREALAIADRIEFTRVHATVEGDAFFPVVDRSDWNLKKSLHHPIDAKHQYAFTFETWERKVPPPESLS
ncbi:dihydrofolate reductase [Candidatus Peregrinibacteria bacterium]|nr:dihydrofolate reductase [Candidatus Peregrinibacteria bacterium]